MALKYSSSSTFLPVFSGPTFDLRGNLRGSLTKEAAKKLVSSVVLEEDKNAILYERIILSTWALSEDAVIEIAASFCKLPKLKSLILADIIAGRPEAEGLSVYRALCLALTSSLSPNEEPICNRIEELDLSDNAVGTKGVEACKSLLEHMPSLKRLFFCNCGISAEAARTITDYLIQGKKKEKKNVDVVEKQQATEEVAVGGETRDEQKGDIVDNSLVLEVIHFDNNMSGGAGAIAIADLISASPKLIDFKYTSSRGDRTGVDALCSALGKAKSLIRLDLHDNIFAEPLGLALGSALSRLNTLVHLDLGDTLLRDEGVSTLISGLLQGGCVNSIEYIDLSCNEISNKGASSVANCLSKLKHLRFMFLQENEFEDKGAKIIAKGIRSRGRLFEQGDVSLQTDDRNKLEFLPIMDRFEQIDFSSNMISSSGALALTRACLKAKLKKLRILKLSGNDEVSLSCVHRLEAILQTGGIGSVEELVYFGEQDEFEEGDDEEEIEEEEEEEEEIEGLEE
jgi:Ran GTPase-activating protein 1